MQARQAIGWMVMALGALGALAGAGLFVLLTANFVEWPNAADALTTIATVSGPALAAGVFFILGGRWLHGGWRSEQPLRRALPWLLRIGGGLAALVYGAMLINVVLQGFGPEDHAAALKLAFAAALGGAAVWAAGRLPRAV